MRFKVGKEEAKLKFGVKFCRIMDERYKVDYEGMEFGMGVNLAFMNLQTKNPASLSDVIRAGLSHKGFSVDSIDDAVDQYADDNDGLSPLFDEVLDAMGKSPTIKATMQNLKDRTEEEKQEEAKENKE